MRIDTEIPSMCLPMRVTKNKMVPHATFTNHMRMLGKTYPHKRILEIYPFLQKMIKISVCTGLRH